ncbi:hypothetical protein Cantr_01169 [Candida viswanathii]|uniref:Vacuolar sorting protein Vps3844 C-terminal domain-containing protein n=1 Tax=Candida viswanathii TaxID=5486 RepID=A0A367YIC9_9ASCO|nr:hypothetical protein Cantr_01169 [Candida viswanathii]
MKLLNVLSWSLLAIPTALAHSLEKEAIVYLLSYPPSKEVSLSKHESLVYLNSFLNADQSLTALDENDDLIDLVNGLYYGQSQQPKMIVSIRGDDLDLGVPLFKSKHLPPHKVAKLTKNLAGQKFKLTPEMTYVTSDEVEEPPIVQFFQYFDHRLDSIWTDFTQHHKQVMQGYSPTNDRIFINELSQLIHLNNRDTDNQDNEVFFVELSSLLSIKRKIGSEAQTYVHSKQVLANLLRQLEDKYDVMVISAIELSSKSFEYGTEDACEVATNSCNSHGKCRQNGETWSCLCEPSFNKTTSKTTTWVGYDCSKKDVSVEANLFLWTSIALVVLLVGGIKLMFSIGNQPLPGVLDAATIPKKG